MLKQLLLTRKIADKRAELEKLKETRAELDQKREALKAREAELEAAVNEVNEETSEEERAALDAEVAEFEGQEKEQDAAEAENDEAAVNLENEIDGLQKELDDLNARANTPPAEKRNDGGKNPTERKESIMRKNFFGLDAEQIRSFLADEKTTGFLSEVRSAIREKRALTNVGLTIPDNMLGIVRAEVARQSKLLLFVNLRRVGGTARMNIMGRIPEAVWTEMCARINEIDLTFNQTEVDGYKVGAAICVCNAILEDSDLALASEIISAISTAIAKALDKAILFGNGTKTPIGIATRLAVSSQPAWWGTNEPEFTDLHTSNVVTLNIKASSGASFFQSLVEKLALAKPKYSSDGLFWAMNRKTHLDIMAKALAFNSSAALVANTTLFPVVGGTIVEFEDEELSDYEIIGGFGGNYLMAERAGIELASSKEYKFLEDQTVFKGTARYDGRPLCGEAFVIVNYNNASPTTSTDFADDEANSVESILLNTHTGAISGTGTLKLKAITSPGKGTVTWATGDSDIATVSTAGVVTGVSAGTAVITATCNGLSDSCTVTVT